MTAQVQAILMDFYGTVADGDRHQVERTCGHLVRDLGLPISAADFALRWGRRFFATVDGSNHDQFRTLRECEYISLRATLAEFEASCDVEPYVEELVRYWQSPPLHAEAKTALSDLTVPVCCVSNADDADVKAAIVAHGLHFDAVVSSEWARSYKPDSAIFERALDLLGVDPKHCMHVGDSLHSDVGGAQRLGIRTVWIERDGRISDIGNARPDFKIKSLLELRNILT